MADLPKNKEGYLCSHPVTLSKTVITDMIQYVGDQEQRWKERKGLWSAVLTFKDVSAYDVNIFREFFLSKKGMFVDNALTNTFTVDDPAIPGAPYDFCVFDQDDFSVSESRPELFNFTLKIRQVREN